MNNKKYTMITVLGIIACLLIGGGITFYVDPVLHYRPARDNLAYPLWADMDRYINNGIMRHYEYDAILSGTSMTTNFKPSEFDKLFGVHSIKVSFTDGSYKEVNDNVSKALEYNPDVKLVVRSVDIIKLIDGVDFMREDMEYPTYLYDDNPFNDVNYLLNKSMFMQYTMDVIKNTIKGGSTTSFDDYTNWNDDFEFGKEAVLGFYNERRPGKNSEETHLSEDVWKDMKRSIEQNFISMAKENPDIEFYYFIAPYSIYYFDQQNQYGLLPMWLEAMELVTAEFVEVDNIHLFSFFENTDMICDVDNYMDIHHYHEDINSDILRWMANGEYELTKDNYKDHYKKLWEFFTNYDYESLF